MKEKEERVCMVVVHVCGGGGGGGTIELLIMNFDYNEYYAPKGLVNIENTIKLLKNFLNTHHRDVNPFSKHRKF